MTATEEDIFRDEQERGGLNRVIADAETALAAAEPGSRRTLQNFVDQAKGRVALLDKKISDGIKEREIQAQERAAVIAQMAMKEGGTQ